MEHQMEKKKELLTTPVAVEENFYVEELENRLEMTAAPGIENKACVVWVTYF